MAHGAVPNLPFPSRYEDFLDVIRAQKNRLFSAMLFVNGEGTDHLLSPVLVLVHFLADPFIPKQGLDVELAQRMCKLDESFVVLHFVVDGFDDVEDLVGISVRVGGAGKLVARIRAEVGLQVLVCRQMNVEPVAPCLDFLSPRSRSPVYVLEDVLEGIRIVVFEL